MEIFIKDDLQLILHAIHFRTDLVDFLEQSWFVKHTLDVVHLDVDVVLVLKQDLIVLKRMLDVL